MSGMDDDGVHIGRPYGGCCILWNSRLSCSTSPVPCDNRRVCALKAEVGGLPLLLVNIYMPCDTDTDLSNMQVYNDVLTDVSNLAEILDIDRVIIGGDFNTDVSRQHSWHTAAVLQFTRDESFSLLIDLPVYSVDYTYESFINGTRSTLDHFVVTDCLLSCISGVKVEHSALSGSDHGVLELDLTLPVRLLPQQEEGRRSPRPLWYRATETDVQRYRDKLEALCAVIDPPRHALQCVIPQCIYHAWSRTSSLLSCTC